MKTVHYDGATLSKLSLGTVQFGLNYGIANRSGKPTQDEVNSIVEYVCAQGVNCFDTAQAYGSSEAALGTALCGRHSHIVSKITSKVSETCLNEAIDTSLHYMHTNQLFALLLHDTQLLYRWEQKHTAMVSSLIARGVIKHFGASLYTAEDFTKAINNDMISVIQIPFNLFDQRALNENWFDQAREKNKLIFIRSIFLQGLLLMPLEELPENMSHARPYLKQLEQLTQQWNMTKQQLALSFVDTLAKDAVLLFGCDTLAQAQDNINTYMNLPPLNTLQLESLYHYFASLNEIIYNPTKWSS